MVYDKIGFVFLGVFLLVLFLSFYFRKYKLVNLILPYKGAFRYLSYFQFFLIGLIFILIVLIPFNIGIYQGIKIQKVPTLNIEVLFDVSLSMTAKDIKPDRFTVAKNSLVEFIKSLDTNYNIGMITFSGKPFVYIPITNDKKALVWKISNMSMADFPPTLDFVGTAIGDAILLGTEKLYDYTHKKNRPGVLVLFTDGDSNKGIKVEDAVKYAKKFNIPIFVGAIGAKPKLIIGQDKYGFQVPTNINFKMLQNIAKETGGEYQKITQKEDFINILSKLHNYVKNYEQTKEYAEYTYLNYYFYWLLLILLILYSVLFIKYRL